MDAQTLARDLIALREQIDQAEAEFSRRLRRFDAIEGWVGEGASSLVAWLRSACRLSAGAAAERVQVARQLAALPEVEVSLRNGEIGYQHAAVIAHSAAENGTCVIREHQRTLLEASQRLDPGGLRLVTRDLRHRIEPEAALDDENHRHSTRFLALSELRDGRFLLDGRLDAEGGVILRTTLNALVGHASADDGLTPPQRRADALVELATRHLQAGELPGAHGRRPHLLLTVSEAALRREPHAAPAELLGVGPMHAETARRMACDAAVTTIAVNSAGEALSVGRTSRTVPPAIRTALVRRDRGCMYPGCDRPAEWTDAHHIVHWQDGGETSLGNLVLLCRRHHRAVHEGRQVLTWSSDGRLQVMPKSHGSCDPPPSLAASRLRRGGAP